jgi:hypothetical protein
VNPTNASSLGLSASELPSGGWFGNSRLNNKLNLVSTKRGTLSSLDEVETQPPESGGKKISGSKMADELLFGPVGRLQTIQPDSLNHVASAAAANFLPHIRGHRLNERSDAGQVSRDAGLALGSNAVQQASQILGGLNDRSAMFLSKNKLGIGFRSPLEQAKRVDWSLNANSHSSKMVGNNSNVFGAMAAQKSARNFEIDILRKQSSVQTKKGGRQGVFGGRLTESIQSFNEPYSSTAQVVVENSGPADLSQIRLHIPDSTATDDYTEPRSRVRALEASDKILVNIESARVTSELGHAAKGSRSTTRDVRVNLPSADGGKDGAPSVANSTVRAESMTLNEHD